MYAGGQYHDFIVITSPFLCIDIDQSKGINWSKKNLLFLPHSLANH